MPSPPRVSFVLPAYNDAERLQRSVGSVQAQTFSDWELVIVDDGSEDETLEVARRLAGEDARIRAISIEHGGTAAARNAGARLATGEWIAVQDCDDYSDPVRLERQLEFLERHPSVGVVGCYAHRVGQDGQSLGLSEMGPRSISEFRQLRSDSSVFYLVHTGVVMRRDLLLEAGGYPEDHLVAEDMALFNVRLAPLTDIVVMQEPLVSHEVHPNQISRLHAGRIVEADDVVRLNLERTRAGLPELAYVDALAALESVPWWRRWERRRRRLRFRWQQQAVAQLTDRSVRGLVPLGLALAISPVWTVRAVASKLSSLPALVAGRR